MSTATLTVDRVKTSQELIEEDKPYVKALRQIILDAKERDASDIHIEPGAEGLEVRFRILGDLVVVRTMEASRKDFFIHETKRLVGLDIGVTTQPLDSRASYPQWRLDLRANSLPTIHGEKIVLRLLPSDREFKLGRIGLSDELVFSLKKAISMKNGVVIISGPTGSGKTTTLYSLLQTLNTPTRNISTLENPVEFTMKGLNQVAVGDDLSFADGLRSFMRQDPDVILVGEIRDAETASLAFEAASTGHMVLTSLHANGAAEAIERLKGLGVEDYLIRSTLRFSACQSLKSVLDPSCAKPLSEDERRQFEKALTRRNISHFAAGAKVFNRNHEGCEKCFPDRNGNPGVIGRVPIMEYVTGAEIKQSFDTGEPLVAKISLFEHLVKAAQLQPLDFKALLAAR